MSRIFRPRPWSELHHQPELAKAQLRRLVEEQHPKAVGMIRFAFMQDGKLWKRGDVAPFAAKALADLNTPAGDDALVGCIDPRGDHDPNYVFHAMREAKRASVWAAGLIHPDEAIRGTVGFWLDALPEFVREMDVVGAVYARLPSIKQGWNRQYVDDVMNYGRFVQKRAQQAHVPTLLSLLRHKNDVVRLKAAQTLFEMADHATVQGPTEPAKQWPLVLRAFNAVHRNGEVAQAPKTAFRQVLTALSNPNTSKGLKTEKALDTFIAELNAMRETTK